MKIKSKQSTLQKYLELLTKISTKHVTLPVLQCVLFEVTKEQVTLKVTNLEIAIEVVLKDVIIEEEGRVAIPAQTLLQTIQYTEDREVILEQKKEEGVVSVECGKTNSSIKTIGDEEFPNLTRVEANSLSIQKDLFSLGIKNTAFAASQSSIKPELGSIYIYQKKEHTLTFVATDSFRLAEKTTSQKGVILDNSFIIPQKNALELARVCDLLDSEVKLLVTENQCALHFAEGVYITSRLVTGTFPDYEAIIPKEFSTHVTLIKQDLTNSLKKTNIFLNKFRQVTFSIKEKIVEISANNGDVGMVSDEVSAQIEGDSLALSFNQQYIIDPLQYIVDDSLKLHFAGVGRPLVIEGVSDNSFRYLVMPMNK